MATLVVEEDSEKEIVVLKDRTGGDTKVPLNVWQDKHRDALESKFLEVPVQNFESLKCDFFWSETPTYFCACGYLDVPRIGSCLSK